MTRPAEHRLLQSIFTPDEPVIQSHPLLADAVIPRFGQTDVWDFNGVVRRNANLPECQWRARFNKALDDPQWNLTARELAMIMANPRHEAVIDARVHLPPTPFDLGTIIGSLSHLRLLACWAQDNELPAQLRNWSATDMRRFISSRHRSGLAAGTVKNNIMLLKRPHEIGPALSLGGPPTDPWRGSSARKAADMPPPGDLATPAIPPEIWFPDQGRLALRPHFRPRRPARLPPTHRTPGGSRAAVQRRREHEPPPAGLSRRPHEPDSVARQAIHRLTRTGE